MKNMNQLYYKLENYILYFITYSFIGWLMEITYMFFTEGTFINRGFLYGPFCPIYGFGALLLIIFLKPMKHNALWIFFASIILTSVLEYFTGLLLESAFGKTWWDYSDQRFNIGGKICLRNSLIWGAFSVLFIYFLQPVVSRIVCRLPSYFKNTTACIFLLYIVFDTMIATYTQMIEETGINPISNAFKNIYSGIKHIRVLISR